MANLVNSQQRCPRVRIIGFWGTVGAQAIGLDEKYPQQAELFAVEFNHNTSTYAQKEFHLEPLDYWNLTLHAKTSDGVHYLSEVNLIKAQYFINVLTMLL